MDASGDERWTPDQGSLPVTVSNHTSFQQVLNLLFTLIFVLWRIVTPSVLRPKQITKPCHEHHVYVCLHQNLEEGFQRLENSQNHVSEESIACRSKTADLDTALESDFFI